MKKILLLSTVFTLFLTQHVAAQLAANPTKTDPTCSASNGSAAVNPTGGSNYTYKWSTGATSSSISNLAAGSYNVTVYSAGGGGTNYNTIYSENFDGALTWTLNVPTGTNDADNNYWEISPSTSGGTIGGCSNIAGSDKTLYITSVSQALPGAAYDAGSQGLCTSLPGFLFCTTTNQAAQSPNISTTGVTNLILSIDFIGNGEGLTDNGSLFYSINGGTNYVQIDPSLKSTTCGGNSGRWTKRTYNLPVNTHNLSNFKIRVNWTNDDNAAGTDPSIAINNVALIDSIPGGGGSDSVVTIITLNPTGSAVVPTITATNDTICASDSTQLCVTSAYASYTWNANASNATSQCVYVRNAGNYHVSVTDNNGCTAQSSNLGVVVRPQPPVSIIRNGDTLASLNASSYQWFRNGVAIPGGNTQVIVASTPGSYTVQITDPFGCKSTSSPILTSIGDMTNNIRFDIYPNPVSNGVLQVVTGKECLGCELQILDATGRIVYQTAIRNAKSEIDVSRLAKGVYLVKLDNAVRQFIKE